MSIFEKHPSFLNFLGVRHMRILTLAAVSKWALLAAILLGGVSPAFAQFTYRYDDLGRLSSVTYTNTGAVKSYTYDAMGNRTQVTLAPPAFSAQALSPQALSTSVAGIGDTSATNRKPAAFAEEVDGVLHRERALDVLSNDRDPDGDELMIVDVQSGPGVFVDIGDDGTHLLVEASEPGIHLIIYTVSDNRGGFATASLSYFVET